MTSQTGPAATVARRGPGRPRNTDSESTKLRILDAAIESFGAGGFSGTSSQTIAAAAGVSAPTVYHHFVNKRQLYVAAFQHSVDITWREYGEAATATGTSLLDELLAVVDAAVGMMQRQPAMTMLAIRAAIDLGRDVLDRAVPDGVLSAMELRAVARGELVVDDVVYVRPVVEMVLWGLSVLGRGDTDLQQRCAEAVHLVLHGRLVQRSVGRGVG